MAKNNNNDHEFPDSIAEVLGEAYETAESNMLLEANKLLVEHADKSPAEYRKYQISSEAKLKKTLKNVAKNATEMLNVATKRAEKYADITLEKILKDNEAATNLLITSSLDYHKKQLVKIHRISKITPLKESIFKQTQEGIKNGLRIIYRNGKSYGYKEYMEMNVRTTIQHEIGESQLKFGADSNVVFYICNIFSDCADDHAKFQGKIYYDERYNAFDLEEDVKKEIKLFIQNNRIYSVQEIKEKNPYLTTRPNCRHKFSAITIEDAMQKSIKKIIDELKLSTGSYKPKNYKEREEQRYNERQIRFYKKRLEENEILYQKTNDEQYLKQMQKDKVLIRIWQARQRKLIKDNPVLERDYRRETRDILLNDLGVKYNLQKNMSE